MKRNIIKRVGIILVFVFLLPINTLAEEIQDEPEQLYAQAAVLMDADTGRILFGKNENNILPMASTTKIMTCILVLENMEERQIAKVSDYAVCQPKVRLGVRGGESYYVIDLLYSLMLESHNDSAVVLAEAIAGSVEEFAKLMNKKAEELSCNDTYFITPNGLDADDEKGGHSTTANDLAKIMKYCIHDSPKKEEFIKITQTPNYLFKNLEGNRTFSCINHNSFLDMMDGALSGKTGFTTKAGYCYVGALRDGKRTFIVSLLACGWPNNKHYKWDDTRKLMKYGLDNYQYRNLWKQYELPIIQVENGADKKEVKVRIDETKQELWVLAKQNEEATLETEIPNILSAPIKTDEKIGTVTYMLNDIELKKMNVVSAENVGERNLRWCLQKVVEQWLQLC